jgi:leader peptidase (prepilin peptidase)/N-methyltransferase
MPAALFTIGIIMALVYGTVVGSFLNVCIYRLPRGESLITPPSHCPQCNARLRTRDLFPLLSFLLLGCKCRYCKTPISWRYFTIEFITGLLFAGAWFMLAKQYPPEIMWGFHGWVLVIALWVFLSAMLVTFVIDLDTFYVFEPVTWVAMAAGLVFEITSKWVTSQPLQFEIGAVVIPYLPAAVPGMILGFLVFIAMDLFGRLIFRKPGMGLGDAYIGAAIGAMLGPGPALLAFGIAVALGAVIGIIFMVSGAFAPKAPAVEPLASEGPLQETPNEDDIPEGRYMPFGPFLTASAVLIAFNPVWFSQQAQKFFHWWFYQNPLFG